MTAQAMFDQRIESVFGWPMAVHAETKTTHAVELPVPGQRREMHAIAAIAAYEAGIQIGAPAHDAFWIMAPLSELDDTIAAMTEIMIKAGRAVAGIDIPVEVAAVSALAAMSGRCSQTERQGTGDVDRDPDAAQQRRAAGR